MLRLHTSPPAPSAKRLLQRVDARKGFEPKTAVLDKPHDEWTIDDLVQVYTQLLTEDTVGNCSSQCLALLEKGTPLTYTALSMWENLSVDTDELVLSEVPPVSEAPTHSQRRFAP